MGNSNNQEIKSTVEVNKDYLEYLEQTAALWLERQDIDSMPNNFSKNALMKQLKKRNTAHYNANEELVTKTRIKNDDSVVVMEGYQT